ncbi:MAG: decaprenyl-phosphate phosphoribosyltransferase [Blastocatellia bacterium]
MSEPLITPRAAGAGEQFLATLAGLTISLRPHQWVKNLLVFSGLIFSGSLLRGELLARSLLAFLLFCLASSGIYLLNDLRDLAADRLHPQKRLRPLATGQISVPMALLVMAFLLILAITGAWLLHSAFFILLVLYLLMNAGYSFGLKHVLILDILIVAMGFVIRAAAGAVVISVEPSPWLILCTLTLALMIVSAKRRDDLDQKRTLVARDWYTPRFLDLMTMIMGGAAIITYALYTQAPETAARLGSRDMLLTVPFVIYGILRYIFLTLRRESASDPAWVFMTDPPMIINAFCWLAVACFVLYKPLNWIIWRAEINGP